MKNSTLRLTRMALTLALILISVYIRVPIPGLSMVFTAQVYMVLVAGLLLGPKDALLTLLAYLALGLCGLPVFSKGGGPQTFLLPEGGFLLGFLVSSTFCGYLVRHIKSLFLSSILGVLVLYTVALTAIAAQFALLDAAISVRFLVQTYCLSFLPLDLLKALAAAWTVRALRRALPKLFPAQA